MIICFASVSIECLRFVLMNEYVPIIDCMFQMMCFIRYFVNQYFGLYLLFEFIGYFYSLFFGLYLLGLFLPQAADSVLPLRMEDDVCFLLMCLLYPFSLWLSRRNLILNLKYILLCFYSFYFSYISDNLNCTFTCQAREAFFRTDPRRIWYLIHDETAPPLSAA